MAASEAPAPRDQSAGALVDCASAADAAPAAIAITIHFITSESPLSVATMAAPGHPWWLRRTVRRVGPRDRHLITSVCATAISTRRRTFRHRLRAGVA